MDARAERYLRAYLDSLPEHRRPPAERATAGPFCADEASTNTCAELVRAGKKTATCSMRHWYTHGNERLPVVGRLHVVTDWQGAPTSIIETVRVERRRFCDVDASFAAAEGEGDRTLAAWRSMHWAFFGRECEAEGIKLDETMPLVLEWFRCVYPNSP